MVVPEGAGEGQRNFLIMGIWHRNFVGSTWGTMTGCAGAAKAGRRRAATAMRERATMVGEKRKEEGLPLGTLQAICADL